MVEQITYHFKVWEQLLMVLSSGGRSLVINNLMTAGLWFKVIALQPPMELILTIQRALVD